MQHTYEKYKNIFGTVICALLGFQLDIDKLRRLIESDDLIGPKKVEKILRLSKIDKMCDDLIKQLEEAQKKLDMLANKWEAKKT